VADQSFRENLKAYVGFDDAASAALRDAHPLVAPHFGAIIDDFYATIEAHADARAAITGGAVQIARLKQSLMRWIDELFRGPHDDAYFERRARIGRVHVQISLPQMYMLTAMDRIRLRSVDVLRDAPDVDPHALRRMLGALHQILDIELAIMLETYRDDLLAKKHLVASVQLPPDERIGGIERISDHARRLYIVERLNLRLAVPQLERAFVSRRRATPSARRRSPPPRQPAPSRAAARARRCVRRTAYSRACGGRSAAPRRSRPVECSWAAARGP
jgi:hypothetical protein